MGAFFLVCPVGFNPLVFLLFQGDKKSRSLYLWVCFNAKISAQSWFWEVGERNKRKALEISASRGWTCCACRGLSTGGAVSTQLPDSPGLLCVVSPVQKRVESTFVLHARD